jgi:predicted glutamine amidotransferase
MCMLCVVPPNVVPSRDKLENSALNNPHGFGYAIAVPEDKRIVTFRTMNADECINRFMEDRKQYLSGYAIWHARYATHGSNTVDNCHPFMVGKDDMTYVGHNGILPVIEYVKDDRSDTRIFAEELLPAIGGVTSLDNPQVWNMLEDFTTGSKVAVLTVNPKAKHQLYLLHENKGMEDSSGVWWSNNTCYLESWYYKYGANTYAQKAASMVDTTMYEEDEDYVVCDVCGYFEEYWQALKTASDSYCPTCGSCFQCGTHKSQDLCYNKSYDNRTDKSYGCSAGESPAWGWY